MTNGKAVLAVLAGIAAGAALGMLLVSDKGSNSRKRVSRKGEELADALNDKIDAKFEELLAAVAGKVKKSVVANNEPGNKAQTVN